MTKPGKHSGGADATPACARVENDLNGFGGPLLRAMYAFGDRDVLAAMTDLARGFQYVARREEGMIAKWPIGGGLMTGAVEMATDAMLCGFELALSRADEHKLEERVDSPPPILMPPGTPPDSQDQR